MSDRSALLLERLWLEDFRSHVSVELPFAPGLTAIVGSNGVGKTNIVEAISWLMTMRSFRNAPNEALVRLGAERAIARAQLRSDDRELLVEAEIPRSGRVRVQLNRQRVQRTRDLLGVMSATVFAPDDLTLIKGGPGERRTWIDTVLAGQNPKNDVLRANVDKVLKQRNALLKGCRGTLDNDAAFTLDVFDTKLSELGDELGALRRQAIEEITPVVSDALGAVAPEGRNVQLSYVAPWFESGLEVALKQSRQDDLRRAVTTVGPHRDEIEVLLEGMPARTHASQGEQRSLALAFRLAQHELVRKTTGVAPLLILDDVFSELDHDRAAALVDALPGGQTLLTSAGDIPEVVRADRTLRISQRPAGSEPNAEPDALESMDE